MFANKMSEPEFTVTREVNGTPVDFRLTQSEIFQLYAHAGLSIFDEVRRFYLEQQVRYYITEYFELDDVPVSTVVEIADELLTGYRMDEDETLSDRVWTALDCRGAFENAAEQEDI